MAEERPRTYDVLGNVLKFLTFPSESDGKFAMVEAIVPKGAGAPPNHHAGEAEAFYVLEGEIGFHLDGQDIVAKAGDHIQIPDGAVHAFQTVGIPKALDVGCGLEDPATRIIHTNPDGMTPRRNRLIDPVGRFDRPHYAGIINE